jgi:multicomponent Na+:H+ antiporter subunit D
MLPCKVDYHPYTAYHVSETLQILLFTALGFFLFIKKLTPEAKISLDMDWFYRLGGRGVLWFARRPAQAVDEWVGECYRACGLAWVMVSARVAAWFDSFVIDGVVDGLALQVRAAGERVRHLQTRSLQFNLFSAIVVIATVLLAYALVTVVLR